MGSSRLLRKDEIDFWYEQMKEYVEANSTPDPLKTSKWCIIIDFLDTKNTYDRIKFNLDGDEFILKDFGAQVSNNIRSHRIAFYNNDLSKYYVYRVTAGVTPFSSDILSLDRITFPRTDVPTITKSKFTCSYYGVTGADSGESSVWLFVGVNANLHDYYYTPTGSGGLHNVAVGYYGIQNYFAYGYQDKKFYLIYPYGKDISTTIPTSGSSTLNYSRVVGEGKYIESYGSNYYDHEIIQSLTSDYVGAGKIVNNISGELAMHNNNEYSCGYELIAPINTPSIISEPWTITINKPFIGCNTMVISL